ncbi:MAG: hypothetical protein RL385_886 [Pseudomonadota bacterium]|jgi:hypothetical protein
MELHSSLKDKVLTLVLAWCAALGGLLGANLAHASNGTISGRLEFTQDQRNCGIGTNTKFPCTAVGQPAPVRRALVNFFNANNPSQRLGSGYTDASGNFNIAWTDNLGGTQSYLVAVSWQPIHIDGRFRIRDSAGGDWFFPVGNFTATHGNNTTIGNWTWGTNTLANVYDGAVRMWEDSLSQSARQWSHFGVFQPSGAPTAFVEIRTNVDDGTCSTGRAWCDLNRICLPTASLLQNQSRVMHEMGHIADCVSERDRVPGRRANDGLSGGGWNHTSDEWHSRQFTESVATAFANVALYGQGASQPFTCLGSNSSCDISGFNLETSAASCTGARRDVLQAERYFWDIYDNTNDNGDTLARGVWEIADTIHTFDPGTANRNRDEVGGSVADPDGHATTDFVQNWITWGTNSTTQHNNNCPPSGDARNNAGDSACGSSPCPAVD